MRIPSSVDTFHPLKFAFSPHSLCLLMGRPFFSINLFGRLCTWFKDESRQHFYGYCLWFCHFASEFFERSSTSSSHPIWLAQMNICQRSDVFILNCLAQLLFKSLTILQVRLRKTRFCSILFLNTTSQENWIERITVFSLQSSYTSMFLLARKLVRIFLFSLSILKNIWETSDTRNGIKSVQKIVKVDSRCLLSLSFGNTASRGEGIDEFGYRRLKRALSATTTQCKDSSLEIEANSFAITAESVVEYAICIILCSFNDA